VNRQVEAIFEERAQHRRVVAILRIGWKLSDDVDVNIAQPAGAGYLGGFHVVSTFDEALERQIGDDDLAFGSIRAAVSAARGIEFHRGRFVGQAGIGRLCEKGACGEQYGHPCRSSMHAL
jgi:hypothetical protein